LRTGAREDARFVAACATSLGMASVVLTWRHPDGPPLTARSAKARDARYALLREYARSRRCGAIVTAHHAEDQAETVLMRLARGSGPDGLAGMASVSDLNGIQLLRPLLCVPVARLRATAKLRAADPVRAWREDPTNQDPQYERNRLRHADATAARETLGLTTPALLKVSARAERARSSQDAAARTLLKEAISNDVALHCAGIIKLELAVLKTAPQATQLAAVQLAIGWAGGQGDCPLSKAEHAQTQVLCARGDEQVSQTMTIHGAQLTRDDASLVIAREWGRDGLPRVPVAWKEPTNWDQRFLVVWKAITHTTTSSQGHVFTVQALGSELAQGLLDTMTSAERGRLNVRTLAVAPWVFQRNGQPVDRGSTPQAFELASRTARELGLVNEDTTFLDRSLAKSGATPILTTSRIAPAVRRTAPNQDPVG